MRYFFGCPAIRASFAGRRSYSGFPEKKACYYPPVKLETFLYAAWQGIKAFLRAVWLAARQLFHQVTGVFFFLLAAIGWAALVREWHRWPTHKLVVTGIFTAVFTLFTVQAFLSARRVK